MSPYAERWLEAFLLTQLIEISVGLALLKLLSDRSHPPELQRRPRLELLSLFAASAITHPPLWFALPELCRALKVSYMGYLALGESLVVLIEALWYLLTLPQLRGRPELALCFAALLNLVSWGLGTLLL